jgi:hypothetical protein
MQWMRLQAVLARLAAPGDKAAVASTLREES